MQALTRFEGLKIPSNHKKVTPSDTQDLEEAGQIFVNDGGDVALEDMRGNVAIYTVPPSSYVIGIFRKVLATGTTAQNIIVKW